MAKMKRNIGELVSGKIGNTVFYQLNGKSYVRAAPSKKRESWTEEQQLYRQRISKVSALWRSLKSEQMSKIWNTAAENMNSYAWFLKLNMPALAMDGTLIDSKLIRVTDGKLPIPQRLRAERMADNPTTINVSWLNDAHTRPERLTDALMVQSYADGHFSAITATGLQRSNLGGTFTLPLQPSNASHVYLLMASGDGKEYSESVCVEV